MSTRFYLESTTITNPINPAFNTSSFQDTTSWSPTQKHLSPVTPQSTAITNITEPSIAGGSSTAAFQFISPQLNGAQSVSGTVSGIMKVLGISANDNYAVSLDVWTSTGTLRGNLFHSISNTGQGTLWPTSSEATATIWNAASITTVSASDGDYIGLQIGGDTGAITGSRQLQIGSNGGSDYALTDGLTTNLNPWIQLNTVTLAFKGGVPNQLMLVGVGI